MAEKAKLPGVKGKNLHNPNNDGSVTFSLRGGPYKGVPVRLYPAADGFTRIVLDNEVYMAAPDDQDPAKPYLMYKGSQ